MPEVLRPALLSSASQPVPRVLRLTVEYSGTHFAGWQIQPRARTVQGELERALAIVMQAPVRLQGASRTDSGVHALGQVATFETTTDVTCARVLSGLNKLCDDDVAVLDVSEAPPGFNARFSSQGKHYRYRLVDRRIRSPNEQAAWHVSGPLDLEAMQEAAKRFVGRHDFVGLATKGANADDLRPTVKTIHEVRVSRQPWFPWGQDRADGPGGAAPDDPAARPVIAIDVKGNAFLYRMVRTIAGTLVQVGKGRRSPESVDAVLSSRDRRAAGPAAPAQGLFLMRVFYEDAPLDASGLRAGRTFDQPVEPSSSEGVSREGHDHRSPDERPRHDPDVRGGEGREARSLLRSAP